MSNPFLAAKRLGQPKAHAAFRKTKYPEIWKLSVPELKHLYSITDDKYKKCAITRAINEKTGIKVIKPTEKQEIARKLNYLSFISSGYKKQLLVGISELDSHLDERANSAVCQARALINKLESFLNNLQELNKPETGPRKRPSKRGTAWKEAEKQLLTDMRGEHHEAP